MCSRVFSADEETPPEFAALYLSRRRQPLRHRSEDRFDFASGSPPLPLFPQGKIFNRFPIVEPSDRLFGIRKGCAGELERIDRAHRCVSRLRAWKREHQRKEPERSAPRPVFDRTLAEGEPLNSRRSRLHEDLEESVARVVPGLRDERQPSTESNCDYCCCPFHSGLQMRKTRGDNRPFRAAGDSLREIHAVPLLSPYPKPG